MSLTADMEHILENTVKIWPSFKNANIFITGGTGFVGKWLLESLLAANERFNLNAKAVVLSRNSDRFKKEFPHLGNHHAISFHAGDVRDFVFPTGDFTHVIHGAIDVSNKQNTLNTYDIIAEGTRRVLEFSREKNIFNILIISSGAVYGRQPPELRHIDEKYRGSPIIEQPETAYGQGKRIAEWFAGVYNAEYGIRCRIARCFAFVGPYLPLNGSFAVGNFIANLIRAESIKIKGDGTPIRSYLYAADMAIWLWTIFVRGTPGVAYNIGSEEEISIQELAARIKILDSRTYNEEMLECNCTPILPERYVPSTQLAQKELGLEVKISLNDGLARMAHWARNNYAQCK